jgi:Domain of unknown function (DUF4384)
MTKRTTFIVLGSVIAVGLLSFTVLGSYMAFSPPLGTSTSHQYSPDDAEHLNIAIPHLKGRPKSMFESLQYFSDDVEHLNKQKTNSIYMTPKESEYNFNRKNSSNMSNEKKFAPYKPTESILDQSIAPGICGSKRNAKVTIATAPNDFSGLQYWIDLLENNSGSRRVTSSHNFRSGDSIKLQIKSGISGFLYVINQEASGNQTYLYPLKGQQSDLIEPGMQFTIPERGSIRFDDVPGNEKIIVALAKIPILKSYLTSALKEKMNSSTVQSPNEACANNQVMFVDFNLIHR